MPQKPHAHPTKATAEEGEVMLDGPDGIATSMTPEAATQSADALSAAAQLAARQVEQLKKAR